MNKELDVQKIHEAYEKGTCEIDSYRNSCEQFFYET